MKDKKALNSFVGVASAVKYVINDIFNGVYRVLCKPMVSPSVFHIKLFFKNILILVLAFTYVSNNTVGRVIL